MLRKFLGSYVPNAAELSVHVWGDKCHNQPDREHAEQFQHPRAPREEDTTFQVRACVDISWDGACNVKRVSRVCDQTVVT